MQRLLQWFRLTPKPSPTATHVQRPVDMLDVLRALGCDE